MLLYLLSVVFFSYVNYHSTKYVLIIDGDDDNSDRKREQLTVELWNLRKIDSSRIVISKCYAKTTNFYVISQVGVC